MVGRVSVLNGLLAAVLAVCMGGCATQKKAQQPVSQPAEAEVTAAEPAPAEHITARPAESESAEPAEASESTGSAEAGESARPIKPAVHAKSATHAKSTARAKPTGHAKTTSPAVAAAATVTMTDQRFEPKTVTIRAGQAVRWKNASKQQQSVTADHGLAKEKGSVSLPKGAKPFNSGDMKPGATYTHTFTVAGTYKYFSADQEKNGMVGEVVVEKAATSAKVAKKKHTTTSTKMAKKKHTTSTN